MGSEHPPSEAQGGPTVRLECFGWVCRELGMREGSKAGWELPLDEGLTAGGLLARLAADQPAFARLVYDTQLDRVHEYVQLLLNDRMIELVGGLEHPLQPGDHLLILPGFSGG